MSRCQEQRNEIIAVSKAGKVLERHWAHRNVDLAASEGNLQYPTKDRLCTPSVVHSALAVSCLGLFFKLNMLNARG